MAIFPFEQAIKNIFLLSAKAFPAKLEQSQTDHMLSGVLEETFNSCRFKCLFPSPEASNYCRMDLQLIFSDGTSKLLVCGSHSI